MIILRNAINSVIISDKRIKINVYTISITIFGGKINDYDGAKASLNKFDPIYYYICVSSSITIKLMNYNTW